MDEVKKPLVLVLSKMSGYVKTLKIKDGGKDKNNKLMYFCINERSGLSLKTYKYWIECFTIPR